MLNWGGETRLFVVWRYNSSSHWTLKMGRKYGPETLVKNQRKTTLGNNPKVTASYCNPGASPKSHNIICYLNAQIVYTHFTAVCTQDSFYAS